MIAIGGAVANLMANPRPILCLDTCDFLDVARAIMRDGLARTKSFGRMIEALASDPNRFQPVITYLVRHEWEQDLEGVRIDAERDVERTNGKIALIGEACQDVGIVNPPLVPFDAKLLVQGLIDLAEKLMNQAVVLIKDDLCVERALERLMEKRRPSHSKEIKDSIHLEHYLEFCRQLRQANFAPRCVFVSANKSDFWKDKETPIIHPDLDDDLQSVGLEFYGRLEAAVGQLGI
jgi:hypothetical protein